MHFSLIYSLKVICHVIQNSKAAKVFSSHSRYSWCCQVCSLAEMASAWMYSYLSSLIFPHIVS